MTFTELSQHLSFGAPWELTAVSPAVVTGISSGLLLRHYLRRRQ